MRWGACIIVLMIVGGCATRPKPKPAAAAAEPEAQLARYYEPASAGSLAFDPPVTIGQPPLQLSREGRATDAFMGYESITATYFYLRTDDRDASDYSGRYERRAISTKVGVTYR